jgi:DNA-binding NarL/FixJ family response regulator
MIKVLIAEDHTLTAKLLENMLNDTNDVSVIGTVSNGYSVLDLAERNQIDVCLLDISMPYFDGIQTLEVLSKKFPEIKVLILTGHTESWIIEKSFNLGAQGFLTKHVDMKEVVSALNKVVNGEYYLDKASRNSLINSSSEILNRFGSIQTLN